jgi:hypothetical protein
MDDDAVFVLEVVLGFPKNSHVHKALVANGLLAITDIVIQDITSVGFDALTYIDPSDGLHVHPNLGHLTRMVSFLWYAKWLRHSGTYGSRIPYRQLTREGFLDFQALTQEDFVTALTTPDGKSSALAGGSTTSTVTGTRSTTPTDPVSDFNRGVKT